MGPKKQLYPHFVRSQAGAVAGERRAGQKAARTILNTALSIGAVFCPPQVRKEKENSILSSHLNSIPRMRNFLAFCLLLLFVAAPASAFWGESSFSEHKTGNDSEIWGFFAGVKYPKENHANNDSFVTLSAFINGRL